MGLIKSTRKVTAQQHILTNRSWDNTPVYLLTMGPVLWVWWSQLENKSCSQPYYFLFRFFLCGPSTRATACKAGERTVAPCSHGATVLLGGCVLPTHPVSIREAFKKKSVDFCPHRGDARKSQNAVLQLYSTIFIFAVSKLKPKQYKLSKKWH